MNNLLLDSCLNHLQQLVAFDTCNPPKAYSASGIIDYLLQQFDLPEVEIKVSDHGNDSINILVTKGDPKLLFNFHMDTVPVSDGWQSDPFQLTVKEDKAYALGACDIKGAAAAMLAVIERYHHSISDFALLFSSDEEHGNSSCIKNFLSEHHPYQGVIVAEPTQAKAVTAHRGIHTFKLSIAGKSGHSSEQRALTENCIHQFSHWSQKAIKLAESYLTQSYKGLSGICFNIGLIQGGIKPNIIADEVTANFGVRPLPGQDLNKLKQELSQLLTDKMSLSDGFSAPALPSKQTAADNEKLAEQLQLPHSEPVNFWTEASLFHQAGYPSIVYGPGNIEQAHAPNEYVKLQQLHSVIENYHRILSHAK
ncbi:acetylornithine deacetylase [Kangiella sp. TOML190]|uniref:acetylornithine deacetylase n=1 Tax=Kangiella sp. TOML190 TaxID=2931351 RepID=UPI00204059D7|nr:acetylornithine deacetylase [Kangiella sp. TOML190]